MDTSAALVIMPKNASTHIQKMAPGPPIDRAVATPAMLPMPTVPASEVDVAWNGVMRSRSWSPPRLIIRPKVFLMM